MGLKSKEEYVLDLLFNSSKHWHFEELLKKSKLSRGRLNHWLNKLIQEKVIVRVKEEGSMPYYVGDFNSPSYKNFKRLYSLEKFYRTGFLNHLQELSGAKTVILFGSTVRSDWYAHSDVDVFIYGDAHTFHRHEFEKQLKRDIELFVCKDAEELKSYPPALLKNIVKGYVVKGTLDFVTVGVHG